MRRLCSLLRGVTAVVALLLLTSCMQVPDSGPVRPGPDVGSDEEPVLRYIPRPPNPGADPLAIVNGYLDAMRAYPPNPGIVRQYLTDEAANAWEPNAGTKIYTEREMQELGVNSIAVEADLLASLTARGEWTELGPSQQRLRREFRLEKEGGQWRIADPAPGLLIPEYDFDRYYRAYSLYFFDPGLRTLVPAPVYLPQGDQTPTLLVRGLLRGPTDWLRGAVDSFLPRTNNADVSVLVSDNGVAQVQLGNGVRALGAAERELLAAQLAWTLRQVPDVEAFRVIAGGTPVALEGDDNVTDVQSGADYDPADSAASQALFALRKGRIVTVDAVQGLSEPVPGRFGSGEVQVEAFAVERTAQTVAAVTADGTRVEVADIGASESAVWFDRARSLLGLQWDIHGLLWAVDRTPKGSRVYVLREGRRAEVALLGDAPTDIRAFSLSRDGLRLAVIEGSGASARLLLGRVRRPRGESLDLEVDHWREVDPGPTGLRGFVDVAWSSPTELTVVAHEEPGSQQTFTMSIDGSVVEPSVLVDLDVVSVADAPVADLPAVVGTRSGELFVQLSDRWSDLGLQGFLTQPSYVE